jgi:phage baseplate assembly protein W
MDRDFLGQGWSFPVSTNGAEDIEYAATEADIEEAIRIIIGTAKGERVMRPDFGCGIHEHVFDTVDRSTLTVIETAVEEALVEWEPRIDTEDVNASTDRLDEGRLDISVDYRVRSTNNEHNLVYPFYIEGE